MTRLRPFMPWLMTILQSRLVDRLRKLQRIASNETAVDALPELPHFGQDGWSAEAYGDAEHLRREIGGLPATQRRAIEMLKLAELSLKEASARGASTATCFDGQLKVLVHRAIKTLRSRLVASMTRETRDLIARLSNNLPAVRRPSAGTSTGPDLAAVAAPSVAAFVFLFSPRRDLARSWTTGGSSSSRERHSPRRSSPPSALSR